MKLIAYKITNFRSIKNTGWKKLAPDNVTVLVGQNESGKSSILRALALTLNGDSPDQDDLRTGAPLPCIYLRLQINEDDRSSLFLEKSDKSADEPEFTEDIVRALKSARQMCSNEMVLKCQVIRNSPSELIYDYTASAEGLEQGLQSALITTPIEPADAVTAGAISPDTAAEVAHKAIERASHATPIVDEASLTIATDVLSLRLFALSPSAVLFEPSDSQLPEIVDIRDKNLPTGKGSAAAKNYFTVAGISLKELAGTDRRARESLQTQASNKVSAELSRFWTQTIGTTSNKIHIKCVLENYGADQDSAKVGQPYLAFWLIDGNNHLYPRQRSSGVSWYLSFFLQLLASEKRNNNRIFLLDEPGANLHAKAQGDVLRLINQLAERLTFVYTTHSPHLIEHSKLYRIQAVQRKEDSDGDSPTEVIDSLELTGASTDTLSPILTTMGIDLSHQNVVKRRGNVILEEPSAYYYFKAFWHLLAIKKDAHFISATGVNKVETLASLFRGWGLQFTVVLDDDTQARKVFQDLTKNFFGDVSTEANKRLLRIRGCHGIEDLFSKASFRRAVLGDDNLAFKSSNSEYLRTASLSKPVLAYKFWLEVEAGNIGITDLDAETVAKIETLVGELVKRLDAD